MQKSLKSSKATEALLVLLCLAAISATATAAYFAPLVPHGELDLVTPAVFALAACTCVAVACKSKNPVVGGAAVAVVAPILVLLAIAVYDFLTRLRSG